MASDATDPDEDGGEDEPKTHHDYRIARNPRANDPEDAGPRDPAANFDGVGDGSTGFEDVLEGDGDVSKSTQEELEDALADADLLGTEPVAKGDDDRVSLAWSRDDFEDDPTEAELLTEIRDELAKMNQADRERALKSLTRDSTHGTGEDIQTLTDRTLDQLEALEGALEAEEPTELTEEQAAKLADLLNAYVEAAPENGLEDPLRDIKAWVEEQALDGVEGVA